MRFMCMYIRPVLIGLLLESHLPLFVCIGSVVDLACALDVKLLTYLYNFILLTSITSNFHFNSTDYIVGHQCLSIRQTN